MARKFSRRLQLESLESRRVLFSYGGWTPPIDPSASAAEHAAHFVQYNTRNELTPDGDVESYNSRSAVDTKLAELVGSYWNGLLGRPVAEVQAVGAEQRYQIADGYGYKVDLSKFQAWSDGQVEVGKLAKTTDGTIYLPADKAISIVDAHDPINLVSHRIEVSESFDSILYVEGDRLIRVSRPMDPFPNQIYGFERLVYRPSTRVEIFDISNRTNPVLTGQFTFEGEHVASAMRNGRLTLVQFSDPNLILPQPVAVTRTDGTQVFETTDQYLARNRDAIYAAVIPSYQHTSAGQSQGVADEIGDWQDFKVALDTIQNRTAILTIDVSAQPRVVDSELILGLNEPIVYVGTDNVYLIKNSDGDTDIFRVSLGLDGSVESKGHVHLEDTVVRREWGSEYEGVLRVVAAPGLQWGVGELDRTSSLLTIGDTGGQWQIRGRVQITTSVLPTSVYFDGPQAVVLAGENYFQGQPATNYIVTLDTSNAAAPRRLSSSQVSGFSTYLKQIDSNHWLGLRYGGPDSRGYLSGDRVITLYSSSSDGFVVLDSWTDKSVFFNTNVPYTDMQIDYDPDTGLVTVDGGYSPNVEIRSSYSPIVLRVALGASDPLQPVTVERLPEVANRTFIQQGTLFVVSNKSVVTYDTADLTRQSDITYLAGDHTVELAGMGHRLTSGQTTILPLLGGYGSDFFKVTSYELTGLEASKKSKVTILDDGMLQIQAANVDVSTSEFLTIQVRYFDGTEGTLYRGIFVTGPGYREEVPSGGPGMDSRTYLETNIPVKIWTSLQDEQGQPVSDLRSGEEAWVVLGAEDLSDLRLGIYGGYFKVNITSGNVEVIGAPDFLGNFGSDQVVTPSENGFSVLGAKKFSWNPTGSARSDIVRFKIRATDDQPINLSVTPTPVPGESAFQRNIMVIVGSEIHSTGNATASVLSTDPIHNTVEPNQDNLKQDVSGDGKITALDALQIINYLNAPNQGQASTVGLRTVDDPFSHLDINGDGQVTALDALLVINTLNSSPRSTASAEGDASTIAWSIDQDILRLKKGQLSTPSR